MSCVRFAVLLIVMQYTIKKCLLLYIHLMALLRLCHPGAPLVALLGRSNFTDACFSSSSGPLHVLFANSLLSVFFVVVLDVLADTLKLHLKKNISLLLFNRMFICPFQKLKIKIPWYQIFILCSTLPFYKNCPCNSAEPSFKNQCLYPIPHLSTHS